MPQNNYIVATLEDQRVITATVLYPQQRIQAQLTRFVFNPTDPIYEESEEENA